MGIFLTAPLREPKKNLVLSGSDLLPLASAHSNLSACWSLASAGVRSAPTNTSSHVASLHKLFLIAEIAVHRSGISGRLMMSIDLQLFL